MAFLSRTEVAQQPRLSGPCCLSSPALRFRGAGGQAARTTPEIGVPLASSRSVPGHPRTALNGAIDGAGPR